MRLAAWGGPSGEESCDDAVALKRSKRIALFFGQIRPLKRPFGAVETRGPNGDVAILRPIIMTRRVTPALLVALRLKPCASLFPTYSTYIAPFGSGQPTTLALTVLRSYGPRLRTKLIRCSPTPCQPLRWRSQKRNRPSFRSPSTAHRVSVAYKSRSSGSAAAMPATGGKAVAL